MRKVIVLSLVWLLILTGCGSSNTTTESSTASLSSNYYRMINKGRGSNSENFYLEYSESKDLVTIGSGLQSLSSSYFSIDNYYLSEGIELTGEDYSALLRRDPKGTKDSEKEYPYTLQVPHGTKLDGVKDPIMVYNLTELDFYKHSGTTYKLAGASFAIILDPHKENNTELDSDMKVSTIKKFSKEAIKKMYTFIRKKKSSLKDLPILIGVYMANDNDVSLVNGNYIYHAYCKDGNVGVMKAVNYENVFFTSTRAEELDPETYSEFEAIKASLKNASTEAAGLVGEAKYSDKKIQSMKITAHLNVKTYTELLYLTGVLAKRMNNAFSSDFEIKCLVYSQDDLMAVITKDVGKKATTTILD